MNQEGRVSTEQQGHVLLIGLDRVARRNAFDRAMLGALGLAYAELERDDQLRCGVLFAHGDHFTGGLELTQFASSLGQFDYPEGAIDPLGLRGPRLTKPLISAVQGICLTVGIELMLAADIRIAASNARLAITEGEEAATRQFLPDLQALMQSEDIKEGVQSFIERRQAHFKGR